MSSIPEKPGLGVEINWEVVKRLRRNRQLAQKVAGGKR